MCPSARRGQRARPRLLPLGGRLSGLRASLPSVRVRILPDGLPDGQRTGRQRPAVLPIVRVRILPDGLPDGQRTGRQRPAVLPISGKHPNSDTAHSTANSTANSTDNSTRNLLSIIYL